MTQAFRYPSSTGASLAARLIGCACAMIILTGTANAAPSLPVSTSGKSGRSTGCFDLRDRFANGQHLLISEEIRLGRVALDTTRYHIVDGVPASGVDTIKTSSELRKSESTVVAGKSSKGSVLVDGNGTLMTAFSGHADQAAEKSGIGPWPHQGSLSVALLATAIQLPGKTIGWGKFANWLDLPTATATLFGCFPPSAGFEFSLDASIALFTPAQVLVVVADEIRSQLVPVATRTPANAHSLRFVASAKSVVEACVACSRDLHLVPSSGFTDRKSVAAKTALERLH